MKKEILEEYIDAGLTQAEIGEAVGKSKSSIGRYMRAHGLKTESHPKQRATRACKNCGVDTKNEKFCGRSCAATWNNKYFIKKKKKKYFCEDCGEEVQYRRKYCDACLPKNVGYGVDPTLSEITYRDPNNRPSAFSLIRLRARKVVENEKQVCEYCGYEKHIEVCHIKAISEFDEETRLSVINARSNLKKLCPNCHWEFDNL